MRRRTGVDDPGTLACARLRGSRQSCRSTPFACRQSCRRTFLSYEAVGLLLRAVRLLVPELVTINQSINHIKVHDLLTRRGIRLWDSEEQHHRSMMITNAIWYNRQCICEAHSIWTFVRYNLFKQNMQTVNEYNQVVSDQVVCALLSILHCSKYFATAFMFRLFLSRNPATVCVSDVKVCENKHEKLLRKLS